MREFLNKVRARATGGGSSSSSFTSFTSLAELRASSFSKIRKAIGDSPVVLIGEATHGTEEFMRIRAEITKLLISEDGFDLVLCEGDFPPFLDLNRFVGGAPEKRDLHRARTSVQTLPTEKSAQELQHDDEIMERAFSGFSARFPGWMWDNNMMRDFVQWTRNYNVQQRRSHSSSDNVECADVVHVMGLDIYSLFRSADAVIDYLIEAKAHRLAQLARQRYGQLNNFRPDASEYSLALYQQQIDSQGKQNKNVV